MTTTIPVVDGEPRRQVTSSTLGRLGGRSIDFNPDNQDTIRTSAVCHGRTNPYKLTSLTCAAQENIRL